MRQNLFLIIIALLGLSSCYKDLSTKATEEYPEITIVRESEDITTSFGETLILKPEIVQEGYTEEDFDFQWKIDWTAGSTVDRLDLGNELELNYKVANLVSNIPYTLSLTVTNKQLGFGKVFSWNVFITSALGEGVIIAHSSDNGATSDIDFFSAAPVSYGYQSPSPTYKRNLFTFANEEPIQGIVRDMTTMVSTNNKVYNTKEIILALDDNILALDNETFRVSRKGAELFFNFREPTLAVSKVFNYSAYSSGVIVNNRFYGNVMNSSCNYQIASCNAEPSNFFTKEGTSATLPAQESGVCAFNPHDGRLYYMPGWNLTGFTRVDKVFSFNAVGARCIGAGALNNTEHGFVLVDQAGKAHIAYYNPAGNLKDYPIDNVPIDEVVSCAFCDNSLIVYLATPTKIYACTISGDSCIVSALSWKPANTSEKISIVQQYRQAWFGTQQLSSYDFPVEYHRAQLIIATYNESANEGKIYLRPYNISTGKFLMKDNGVYDGFGKISAIATTLR